MSPLSGQRTIRRSVFVKGIGIHTGHPATVTIHPAEPNTGRVFITPAGRVKADYRSVSDTRRSTCIESKGASVRTVEHLLSALAGLEIDNCTVEVEGPELPILDGSALQWVEMLNSAGISQSDEPPKLLALDAPVSTRTGESWLTAVPADDLQLTVVTEWNHPLLGRECTHTQVTPESYTKLIAPARTFGFIEEVRQLLDNGLALGGTLDNALVIYPDRFSSPLRLPMECNRHKILDLLGDLALAGGRIQGSITAILPSHKANVEMAAALAQRSKEMHG